MATDNRGRDFLFSSDGGFINGEDGESYRYSDGSGYYHGADGSDGYRYSDGSGYFNDADGDSEHFSSETVFRQGKVEYSRITPKTGRYERLYRHNGKYYLLSGVGENGFIVSTYPVAY